MFDFTLFVFGKVRTHPHTYTPIAPKSLTTNGRLGIRPHASAPQSEDPLQGATKQMGPQLTL